MPTVFPPSRTRHRPRTPYRTATLRGVEMFAAGTYNGEAWTPEILAEVVRNFADLSAGPRPLHEPPAVLGHEADQEWLKRTDLPAAGWVKRLSEGSADIDGRPTPVLVGDVAGVPEAVVDLVNAGFFRKISAELYRFTDNAGRDRGWALRRVAFLGAEVPKVKGLAPLPAAEFSESAPTRVCTRVFKFAEVSMATASGDGGGKGPLRDTLEASLTDVGFSTEFLDSLTDDQLGMLVRDFQAIEAAEPDAQGAAATGVDATGVAVPPDVTGKGAKMSEQATGVLDAVRAEAEKVFAELRQETAAVRAEQKAAKEAAAKEALEADRRRVREFCERLRDEGRIDPAELDDTDPETPPLPARLLALRGRTIVRTFAEGGKAVTREQDALAAEMARLGKLPGGRNFGERVPQGGAAAGMNAVRRAALLAKTNLGRAVLRQEARKN